jgi:hypothetical protein
MHGMKKIMLSIIILFTALLFSPVCTAQQTADEVIGKFFELYESKGADASIDYVFSTSKWMEKNKEVGQNIKHKLDAAIALIGKYHGHELVLKKQVGASYLMLSYMIKYDRQPLQFTFILYKPDTAWQIQNLKFDDKLDDDLEAAPNSVPEK